MAAQHMERVLTLEGMPNGFAVDLRQPEAAEQLKDWFMRAVEHDMTGVVRWTTIWVSPPEEKPHDD